MPATSSPASGRLLTEGELWAREQLGRLLAARFGPHAVARFLAASQQRANAIRRARPELARQEAVWGATGAAAWIVLARAGPASFRGRGRAGLGGWALTLLMLDRHLGMVETEDGRPRALGAADAATLLRAWLAPAVAGRPTSALCVLGFATDVLDGRLARRAEPTRLGRDLEGLVDAAFQAAALRGARRQRAVGRIPVAAELGRLGGGFGYALLVYLASSEAPDPHVLRAGRLSAPLRAAGLFAAGRGRRRLADALLLAGSAAALGAVARTSERARRSAGSGDQGRRLVGAASSRRLRRVRR